MSEARLALLALTGLGVGALVPACSGDSVAPPEPTTVTVTPSVVELDALESTAQLSAEIRDQRGQVMNVPWTVWSSGDANVARVDSAGLVTAAANGAASVTATVGRVSGSAAVTVAQKARSVVVSPVSDTVPVGDTLRLVAEAADANGHGVDGAQFLWTSGDPQVAVVDNTGLVTAVGDGDVEVTASSSEIVGRAVLTVEAPTPTAVQVTPDTVEFTALGQTADLAAEVLNQGGNVMADVAVSWSSSAPGVAAVDAGGVVTASANGTAKITATAGSASGTAEVAVAQEPVGLVGLAPDTASFGKSARLLAPDSLLIKELGAAVPILLTGKDANGQALSSGAKVTWSSTNPAVATVDSRGLVTAVANGRTDVTIAFGSASGGSTAYGSANATLSVLVSEAAADRDALVALYEAADGPNWVNSENWLTDAPLGKWYGVETNAQGRVVRLDLRWRLDAEANRWKRHGLRGPIPPELGNLAKLEWLNLHGNELTGPIPPELGSLSNLRVLGLEYNGLTGAIPPELGNLDNLTYLRLGTRHPADFAGRKGNNLTGTIPPELGNLANLQTLNLGSNNLTGSIPPELGNLALLERLSLASNDLIGPIPLWLGNLATLKTVFLQSNNLTGTIPARLGNLDHLEDLLLNSNDLTGAIPPELGSLTNLTWLGIGGNDLTGTIPPELGSLTNLVALSFSHNPRLTGRLPRTFLRLGALLRFLHHSTDTCAPADQEFQDWVKALETYYGRTCAG